MKKTIWIAREFDDNSDAMRVTFDREQAEAMAQSYFDHLTAAERKTHTVSIEGYIVEVADDDTRDADTLWSDLIIEDDPATYNPDYYSEVKV